ncbi:MAG: hypothetical protein OEL80_07530 [Desulfuromonadales bacterium]|jgi:hypothetical protein|nr:hypothetical protein [Desulfuromonadales bacterium]
MSRTATLMTVCFCAGLLGALCSSLVIWQAGQMGFPAMAGVRMSPALTPGWLYSRLVWGGIWGLAYFLAVGPLKSRRHWARKGLWISLLPTAFQLFFVYPHMTQHGLLGLDLGQLTPLFIFLYNLVWGLCTGIFCRLFWGRG